MELVVGNRVGAHIGPHVVRGPCRQRAVFPQAVLRVPFAERQVAERQRLLAAQAGNPAALAGQGAAQRLDLADGAACLAQAKARSEEHTSAIKSLMRISYADFCLKTKK